MVDTSHFVVKFLHICHFRCVLFSAVLTADLPAPSQGPWGAARRPGTVHHGLLQPGGGGSLPCPGPAGVQGPALPGTAGRGLNKTLLHTIQSHRTLDIHTSQVHKYQSKILDRGIGDME